MKLDYLRLEIVYRILAKVPRGLLKVLRGFELFFFWERSEYKTLYKILNDMINDSTSLQKGDGSFVASYHIQRVTDSLYLIYSC